MFRVLNRLFSWKGDQISVPSVVETVAVQSLILTVVPAPGSLGVMDLFEHRLSASLGTPPLGAVDGHEIALSGKDALIFLHGLNAQEIYEAVRPVVAETEWIETASVCAILGDPNDMDADVIRFNMDGGAEWPR